MSKKNKCQNSDIVKLVNEILSSAKKSVFNNLTPISKSEIGKIQKALDNYNVDCEICINEGSNDYKCHAAAERKLIRAMPFMRKNIYPYRNFRARLGVGTFPPWTLKWSSRAFPRSRFTIVSALGPCQRSALAHFCS